MVTYMNIIMEVTKGLGQRKYKGVTKDCFLFGSFFPSNISAECVKDLGSGFIGLLKTDTKVYCK